MITLEFLAVVLQIEAALFHSRQRLLFLNYGRRRARATRLRPRSPGQ